MRGPPDPVWTRFKVDTGAETRPKGLDPLGFPDFSGSTYILPFFTIWPLGILKMTASGRI